MLKEIPLSGKEYDLSTICSNITDWYHDIVFLFQIDFQIKNNNK